MVHGPISAWKSRTPRACSKTGAPCAWKKVRASTFVIEGEYNAPLTPSKIYSRVWSWKLKLYYCKAFPTNIQKLIFIVCPCPLWKFVVSTGFNGGFLPGFTGPKNTAKLCTFWGGKNRNVSTFFWNSDRCTYFVRFLQYRFDDFLMAFVLWKEICPDKTFP